MANACIRAFHGAISVPNSATSSNQSIKRYANSPGIFSSPRANLKITSRSSFSSSHPEAFQARPSKLSAIADRVSGNKAEYQDIPSEDVEEPSFAWKSAWYAVHVVKDMDPSRPHSMSLLGRPIVLWRDVDGKWRCFLDMCPHRLVPLSEGRIDEAGNLQCSYHGWSFDAQGSCARIPQAANEGPEAGAAASPRACATALPTCEEKGLLFVWPDERGWSEAESTPLPFSKEMLLPSFSGKGTVRDLSYGYELLAENVVDMSHLPFAHHGLGQLNREKGQPLPMVAKSKGPGGFEGETPVDVLPSDWTRLEFVAPSLFTYNRYSYKQQDSEGNARVGVTALFITPTTPYHSRLIVFMGSNVPFKGPLTTIFRLFPSMIHLVNNDILDGDSFFLHAQEKALEQLPDGSKDWRGAYYMPTTADRFVVAFRQWLDKYAGGSVGWQLGAQGSAQTGIKPAWQWDTKEKVLDRYNSHTKMCLTCTKALTQLKNAQLIGACVSAALLAVASVMRGNVWQRGGVLIVSLMAAGFAVALQGLIRKYIYLGYDHAKVK